MSDRFVTVCDRFVTAFEKMEKSKKLGKSRVCGYRRDRSHRNDSFFSLLHVRAYIYNSFLFVISVITVTEKEKKKKKARKIKGLQDSRQKRKAVTNLSLTCHSLSQTRF